MIFKIFLSALLCFGIFSSCSDDGNKSITEYPTYHLDQATISRFYAGTWDARYIILRLGISETDLKLLVYLADDHNQHARDVTPINLQPQSEVLQVTPGRQYVLGSNYISLGKLRPFFDALRAPTDYVKLSPVIDGRYPDHITFRLSSFVGGNEANVANNGRYVTFNESNPSPPAPPDDPKVPDTTQQSRN